MFQFLSSEYFSYPVIVLIGGVGQFTNMDQLAVQTICSLQSPCMHLTAISCLLNNQSCDISLRDFRISKTVNTNASIMSVY